jgi:hypothetical protein
VGAALGRFSKATGVSTSSCACLPISAAILICWALPAGGGRRFGAFARTGAIPLYPGLNEVSRDNGKRRIYVEANVSGRDLGSFVDEAQREIGAR